MSAEAGIVATTGYQRPLDLKSLEPKFFEALTTDRKIEFIQFSLRSGLDVVKLGGHVTSKYSDRTFNLNFDNKRFIIDKALDTNGKEIQLFNHEGLLDSKPLLNTAQAEVFRYFASFTKPANYSKFGINLNNINKKLYQNYEELAIRNFIRALTHNQLNLELKAFNRYEDIVKFIHLKYPKYKLTTQNISLIKGRGAYSLKTVPNTKEVRDFVDYILIKFPNFDKDLFIK